MKESPISDAEFEAFLEANEIGHGTSGYKYIQDYVQKKYQEGELNGRIAEQDDWVKPWTENAVEWEQDGEGSGIQYFDGERLDRYRQLKSQLERKEQ